MLSSASTSAFLTRSLRYFELVKLYIGSILRSYWSSIDVEKALDPLQCGRVPPTKQWCQPGRLCVANVTVVLLENLKRHLKTHHAGATGKKFSCKKCHSQFARRHQGSCSQSGGEVPTPERIPDQAEELDQPEYVEQSDDIINDEINWQDTIPDSLDLRRKSEELASLSIPNHGDYLMSTPEEDVLYNHSQDHFQSITLPGEDLQPSVAIYFEDFHPSLPFIHEATFAIHSAPRALVEVMAAIGMLYRSEGSEAIHDVERRDSSRRLWRSSVNEIKKIVHSDQHKLKVPWVLQCWILCIIYGTFTANEHSIAKARNMFRYLLDAVRELQLLHQRLTLPPEPLWITDLNITRAPGERLLSQKWATYINQESLKLSVYALYFLDFHLFSACNIRPSILSIEFEWDLPLASEIWQAENANDWWSSVSQHEKDILPQTNHIFMDPSYRQHDHQTKSLLAATQALLTDAPSKRLLSTLEASPFATMCLTANLECLIRDFTRCYYQLPPNPTDPSPFHVLTQRQNAQVATALGYIWGMMRDGPCTACSEACTSLWHAVRIGCLSIKIAMSKPDDLLVSGIVECNPIAGLATAAHLTLGNYVTARRSGLSLQKTGITDDGIVVLLDDLLKGMHEMFSKSMPRWEGPWTFIQGFRLLLTLWRALRMSLAEIQSEADTPGVKYPRLSQQNRNVVKAVLATTQLYEFDTRDLESQQRGWDDVEEKQVEEEYMQWMNKVCEVRAAWGIGSAMSEVLEEISSMTTDPVSLRQ
ncbi:hypothetical protein BP6252_12536 [Coleophoma cylindrospora]|uniref:Xylanolytic transcriptional activator regulatory domain-containing protein n=1 Tax=Coleophoma cylindrospora TaxID=1849047 RepID=A0A3D8QCD9_9HELO|nr:hypothetical protein BP6252_12536 [Coleophoma cylindrospora]